MADMAPPPAAAPAADWIEVAIERNREVLARRHDEHHESASHGASRRRAGTFLSPKSRRTNSDAMFQKRGCLRSFAGIWSDRRCTRRNLSLTAAAVSFICVAWLFAALILEFNLQGPLQEGYRKDGRLQLGQRPRNIIFMVSDGFGISGATLARMYKTHLAANLTGQQIPTPPAAKLHLDEFVTGHVHTYSASSLVTDSAAGATAWACGLKTNNHMIAVDPVSRQPCGTLFEAGKRAGMATGVAVTSSVTDATPASFTAHARQRNLEYSIALQYAINRTADVVLGGGAQFFTPEALGRMTSSDGEGGAHSPAYHVVHDSASLAGATEAPLIGLFAADDMPWEIDRDASRTPSLTQMATKAVALLSARSRASGARGFFLLVEGSKIDKAAHPNDAAAFLREVLAYDEAVGAMLSFAKSDGETLVLSTSDHETGGLSLGRGVLRVPADAEPSAEAALDAQFDETPLRSQSLLGESRGQMDSPYEYAVSVLGRVRKSSEAMVAEALAACGSPSATTLAASPAARDTLLAALEATLLGAGLPAPLLMHERSFLLRVVQQYDSLGTYGLRRAIGAIVSARARLGWTTFGHTGTDVMLHAYGPGSDQLRGSMENIDIGNAIAAMMGWDMAELTSQIGKPAFAQQDIRGRYSAFANWE